MNILFNVFKKVFAKQFEEIISSEKNDIASKAKKEGMQEERSYRENQKNECLYAELEMMIGKPVINISNEWDNPIIGFGKEIQFITQAKVPVLIIEDYVSGENKLVLSVPFYFSEQRFNAFAKLDPFEICSIVYKNSVWMEPFDKVKSGVFEGYDVIREKLIKAGFFERLSTIEID
jgi:hypothetical protein